MNLIKKLVSLLFGDEEKETDDFESQSLKEQQAVKNVLSDATPNVEFSNQRNHKAEARVTYQYPKGNFRFPIIPDESLLKRDDRPKRPGYQEDNQRKQQEQKKPTYSQKQEPLIQKETIKVNKKRFHPSVIPSPVYGFQSREERMQDRPLPPVNQSLQKNNSNETSSIFEKNGFSSESEERNHINEVIENTAHVEMIHKEEQFDLQSDMFLKSDQLVVEEEGIVQEPLEDFGHGELEVDHIYREEELVLDEALTIVKSEYLKKIHDEQAEVFQQDDAKDLMPNRSTLQDEDNDVESKEAPILEIEQSTKNNQDEYEIKEGQSSTYMISSKAEVDETNLKSQIQAEHTDEIKQDQNKDTAKRKTVPFNVMMLGRDKQRLQENIPTNNYQFPSLGYLNIPDKELTEDHSWLESQKDLLNLTLKNFNVRASVVNVTQGPSVTRFEVHPEPGVKVNKITNLSDDIKLSLSAKDIRIEAPIPGKNTIGIEVPNKVSKMVYLREILRSNEFRSNPSPMTAVLGLDIAGQPAVTDLKKMPHGLIAGATGSGKSVCINTILVSLLYKASPHEVKLMLIDPKMVELAPYNEIPHLVSPVITDVKAATAALKWAVEEMERRYELFAHSGTREITRYNQLVKEHKQGEHLPYLVIIIDELADLMMVAPNDVEEAICRIAQKARACGIHLIVATQRPSVDVITGLIKANIPTRIAFSVSSQVDSRTIIDVSGAEKLLGRGDMLFLENGSSKAVRLQGTFVSDEEIERVVNHVKLQSKPDYLFHQDELVKKATIQSEEDELFLEACEFVVNQGGASTSSLQRRFRIGYNRAARLIDMMEEQGIISENRGSKPRDILISEEELDSIQESHVL